jgi:DNA primase
MYDRDALLAAVDLRELADDLLGAAGTNGRARMWPCPNRHHAQTGRTPPVSIFTSRRGDQRWRCHGCGDGGTAIDLVLACHGGTARDAMTFLAERAGHRKQSDEWRRPVRSAPAPSTPPSGCRDQQGLDRYVAQCAERLWKPEGRRMRQWLIESRGLPRDVLVENRIGADLGPRVQERPDGMPRAAGIVLPVIDRGHAVYAQIRIPDPRSDGPRYLNPASDLATSPRLSRARPAVVCRPEIVVTEGEIDALSAAAAGYRSVAVLSATYSDEAVAVALAKLPHPLVLAFDADDAGRAGAHRLEALLVARQRPPLVLDLEHGDLNDTMRGDVDWPSQMQRMVDSAIADRSATLGESVSR